MKLKNNTASIAPDIQHIIFSPIDNEVPLIGKTIKIIVIAWFTTLSRLHLVEFDLVQVVVLKILYKNALYLLLLYLFIIMEIIKIAAIKVGKILKILYFWFANITSEYCLIACISVCVSIFKYDGVKYSFMHSLCIFILISKSNYICFTKIKNNVKKTYAVFI